MHGSYLPRLLLQVSDLVCNDCQFVAGIGFYKLISLGGGKQNTYSDITHIHYENNLKVKKITKTESNPHLLDLLCKSNQIHGVSNSVGLVGTNQFQPTGSTAALNQSHCKKIK